MHVDTDTVLGEITQPRHALIIHANNEALNNATFSWHDISSLALKAGKPISSAQVFEKLAEANPETEHQASYNLLPEHVLLDNQRYLMWYRPSRVSNLYGVGPLKKIEWPAALFTVSLESRRLYILALPNNERPTMESALYRYPMPNIYQSHALCYGTAKPPELISIDTIEQLENAFYYAKKTGALIGQSVNDKTQTLEAFWSAHAAPKSKRGKPKPVKPSELKPNGTLKQWLEHLAKEKTL